MHKFVEACIICEVVEGYIPQSCRSYVACISCSNKVVGATGSRCKNSYHNNMQEVTTSL